MTRRGSRKECKRCGKSKALSSYTSARGLICATCRRNSKKNAARLSHEARVMDTYGLLKGEYEQLLAYQGGVCAICHGTRKYRLSVDHDHKTGAVRGLLCRLCNNRLLTAARDKPDRLRRAADYLEHPPAIELLGERIHIDNREEGN